MRSITLNEKDRRALSESRKSLLAALEVGDQEQAELERLNQKRGKVQSEITKLEAVIEADPVSADGSIQRLATLRDQQKVLESHIGKLERVLAMRANDGVAVADAMYATGQAIKAAMQDYLNELIELAASALEPHSKSKERARMAAQQTDSVSQCQGFIYGMSQPVSGDISQPRRVLSAADKLLSGQLPWHWPASNGKPHFAPSVASTEGVTAATV